MSRPSRTSCRCQPCVLPGRRAKGVGTDTPQAAPSGGRGPLETKPLSPRPAWATFCLPGAGGQARQRAPRARLMATRVLVRRGRDRGAPSPEIRCREAAAEGRHRTPSPSGRGARPRQPGLQVPLLEEETLGTGGHGGFTGPRAGSPHSGLRLSCPCRELEEGPGLCPDALSLRALSPNPGTLKPLSPLVKGKQVISTITVILRGSFPAHPARQRGARAWRVSGETAGSTSPLGPLFQLGKDVEAGPDG